MVGLGWCVDAQAVWAAPAAGQASWQSCDARCRELVRTKIGRVDELRTRWRRGNALVGLGVPLALGGVAMTVLGGTAWSTLAVDRFDQDPAKPAPVGWIVMTFAGAATFGGAVTMIVFGARERNATRREARHRLSLSFLPSRRGALLGASLRF